MPFQGKLTDSEILERHQIGSYLTGPEERRLRQLIAMGHGKRRRQQQRKRLVTKQDEVAENTKQVLEKAIALYKQMLARKEDYTPAQLDTIVEERILCYPEPVRDQFTLVFASARLKMSERNYVEFCIKFLLTGVLALAKKNKQSIAPPKAEEPKLRGQRQRLNKEPAKPANSSNSHTSSNSDKEEVPSRLLKRAERKGFLPPDVSRAPKPRQSAKDPHKDKNDVLFYKLGTVPNGPNVVLARSKILLTNYIQMKYDRTPNMNHQDEVKGDWGTDKTKGFAPRHLLDAIENGYSTSLYG